MWVHGNIKAYQKIKERKTTYSFTSYERIAADLGSQTVFQNSFFVALKHRYF
jgi:hypothetical protein